MKLALWISALFLIPGLALGGTTGKIRSTVPWPTARWSSITTTEVLLGPQPHVQDPEGDRPSLRLRPDSAAAHNNLGQILSAQGRATDAATQFREALRLLPDSAEVHNNLGAALQVQGKLEEAIGHFRRALELDPNHGAARDNLNVALNAPSGSRSERPGR